MATDISLPINPNLIKLADCFPFLINVDGILKREMTAWEKIDNSDFQFLSNLLKSKGIKVNLDDVCFVFNYFKFIYRVSKSDFNKGTEMEDKYLKELWPFFQLLKQKEKLKKISFQMKCDELVSEDENFPDETKIVPKTKTIKFTTEYSIQLFLDIFEHSIKPGYGQSGMIHAKTYLTNMERIGKLDSILKKRPGNKTNYTQTIIKQTVTMFKYYLKKNADFTKNEENSIYAVIGKILAHIGLIPPYSEDSDKYNSAADYYGKKTIYLDLDHSLTKTTKIADELFYPVHFIFLNKNLIAQ